MCKCSFIPPFVLENMAKEDIEDARISVLQSLQTADERSCGVMDVASIFGGAVPTAAMGSRYVYDSGNTNNLKVKLVRSEGQPPAADTDVNNTYDFAGVTRDFYKTKLNRNSINGLGMDLILNIHFGVKYMNAFWNGSQMVFGDGDGKIFTAFDRSLDVVAHELTHGVTQYTANLVYDGQSGALNEHFSDALGSAIQQYFNKETAENADWLIGDEIMGPTLIGEALRSMQAPGTAYDNSLMGKDPQPDHMKNYYTGASDNHGVHINSGIPNKAFYLVSMDIGTDKAAIIWYEGLKNLWPTAQFADAVKVLVRAAQTFVKAGTVPKNSTQSVRSAFKQVGLY
jgi:Zn-dependent metalloprotease